MKQFTTLAVAAAALLLGACAEDSSRPTPKGEGTLRAINAIPTSGEFRQPAALWAYGIPENGPAYLRC